MAEIPALPSVRSEDSPGWYFSMMTKLPIAANARFVSGRARSPWNHVDASIFRPATPDSFHCTVTCVHRRTRLPDEWFDPCTCEWQFRQALAERNSGPGSEGNRSASAGRLRWPTDEWHAWHNCGARRTSKAGWLEPCGKNRPGWPGARPMPARRRQAGSIFRRRMQPTPPCPGSTIGRSR